MIEFLCPNGHRIRCQADLAGKAAKCPQCGVKFRIPDPSEAEVVDVPDDATGTSDPNISRPELTDSGIAESPTADDTQIEFLCPNGHRLHGPADLQGQAGECPECGSRFRIPTYDIESPGEAGELDLDIRLDSSPSAGLDIDQSAKTVKPAGRQASEIGRALAAATTDSAETAHPLAPLFARLWAEKRPGAVVELHLANGDTLVPAQFAAALSQHTHGVFAEEKEARGTHTLTLVACQSVVRVVIRGVQKLPEEMSE